MNEHPEGQDLQFAAGLRKVLNSHGHGFHHAVLKRTQELTEGGQCAWAFVAAEFPVVVGGITVHADFILRSRSGRTYLIAECKRADPSRARWAFIRAPYTWRDPNEGELVFDQIVCEPPNFITAGTGALYEQSPAYHLGLEMKLNVPAEGVPQSGSAINQAVSQVLRATSGFINYKFAQERRACREREVTRFIPVVITTAQLVVSDVDISGADLLSGDLPSESVSTQEVPRLWFNHHRSPALRPDHAWMAAPNQEMSAALKREFSRAVAIVNPAGLDNFLKMDLDSWWE
jgi:hypothetical protein